LKAGIHLPPKLGILLHPLDEIKSGFHGQLLAGIFGMEVARPEF
jgi:hypothetical protein